MRLALIGVGSLGAAMAMADVRTLALQDCRIESATAGASLSARCGTLQVPEEMLVVGQQSQLACRVGQLLQAPDEGTRRAGSIHLGKYPPAGNQPACDEHCRDGQVRPSQT